MRTFILTPLCYRGASTEKIEKIDKNFVDLENGVDGIMLAVSVIGNEPTDIHTELAEELKRRVNLIQDVTLVRDILTLTETNVNKYMHSKFSWTPHTKRGVTKLKEVIEEAKLQWWPPIKDELVG